MRAYTESSGDLVKKLCVGLKSKWILKNLCKMLPHFAGRTNKNRLTNTMSMKVYENIDILPISPGPGPSVCVAEESQTGAGVGS